VEAGGELSVLALTRGTSGASAGAAARTGGELGDALGAGVIRLERCHLVIIEWELLV
jgi:hypothetical protein